MKRIVFVLLVALFATATLTAGDQWGHKKVWSRNEVTVDVDSAGAYSRANVPILQRQIATFPAKDFGKMWVRIVCDSAPTFTGDTVAFYFKAPDGTILATDSLFAAATKTFYIKVDTTTVRFLPEVNLFMTVYLDSTFTADNSYTYQFTLEYLWKP